MSTVIFGNGHLGSAIAAALVGRGDAAPIVLGRPGPVGHDPAGLVGLELAFEASTSQSVAANVAIALDAGCRSLVIATTAWDRDRATVEASLRAHGAAAVAAPNLSLGVAAFLRVVDTAARLFAALGGVDPFVVEWHRRGKADRPSGTAREIARRLLAADPVRDRIGEAQAGPAGQDTLEVASIRAGAAPGTHLVGFDGPGETIELRLTARDRSPYALGALAAADWLRSRPRDPGIHSFDEVADDLLSVATAWADKPQAVAGVAG